MPSRGYRGRRDPAWLASADVLDLRLSPPEAATALATSAVIARLRSGDALDQAMHGAALLGAALEEARAHGATEVRLVVEGAGEVHEAMARAHGMQLVREILQLRCDLPLEVHAELGVRPFAPGTADERAWLEVNNRAFAWHPEQSGWSLDDLHARMAEPWFDPDGFLLHEHAGRLEGFCWTKVHDTRPPVGEIYVIGVDPSAQGHGLGRQLVLAGLDNLSARGLGLGMLWVEADNAAALALYRSLGFHVADRTRWWSRRL
jgi:mycothiol synthase